jgi:lipopolysaccharide export system protein LptA
VDPAPAAVPPGGAPPGPSGTPPASRPALKGDQISLMFHEGGNLLSRATTTGHAVATLPSEGGARTITAPWLDLQLGSDGSTVIGIDARPVVNVQLPSSGDTPARTIDAGTLAARGRDGRGLQSARFDAADGGVVTFSERPAGRDGAPTTARSRVLVLALAGNLGALTSAEFRQGVVFNSRGSEARGEWALYHAERETLDLKRQSGDAASPFVTQDTLWVAAPSITLGLAADDVDARGGVATRVQPGATGGRQAPSLFDATRVVFGAADTLKYGGTPRVATYTGTSAAPAELRQEDGTIVAGEVIVVDDETGTLTATRQVRTRFRATEGAGPQSTARIYTTTSDAFDYRDETRLGVHRGAPATLESEGRRVDAAVIELHLARESQALDRLVATGAGAPVYARLDKDHEAIGDRLEYTAATGVYVLTGKPVEVVGPDSEGKGCYKTVGVMARFERETRQASWPVLPDGRHQNAATVTWPCGKPIR